MLGSDSVELPTLKLALACLVVLDFFIDYATMVESLVPVAVIAFDPKRFC
jgi:hypothetical protein